MRSSYLPSPRARAQGTSNIGPSVSRFAQVPSGFQDRDDGTVWYLAIASDAGDGVERIALNTEQPGAGLLTARTRLALSEPFLGNAEVRVFTRGGRLGFETLSPHIYYGARLTVASIPNWTTVRYELKPVTGGPIPPDRLAFETEVDW